MYIKFVDALLNGFYKSWHNIMIALFEADGKEEAGFQSIMRL